MRSHHSARNAVTERRDRGKNISAIVVVVAAMAISSYAQTFTSLGSLSKTTGDFPRGPLAQGPDGSYYGIATEGGPNTFYPCGPGGCGTVFKYTPGGTITLVHKFKGTRDGDFSSSGLTLVTNGDLYGTTPGGGANNDGTVFEITARGTLINVHSFAGTDGAYASPTLVWASNNHLYGTTQIGGANNAGTVFEMTPLGALTTIYNFCSNTNCTDGAYPTGGLVQGANGDFYGTTFNGGANNWGVVFQITPAGKLTVLHSFIIENGNSDNPTGPLVQASNGKFYGLTQGGAKGYGTVYEITDCGKFRTIHRFLGSDGSLPLGALMQATDGNLYGTTQDGGGYGSIFQITLGGTLTTVHLFDGTHGGFPQSGLVQGTDGVLYGATYGGGVDTCPPVVPPCGTVYSLSMGLGPFVTTSPIAGPIGRFVLILGTDLSAATSVTFNGQAAAFTVLSPTEIKTQVPRGASSGTVQVVTPSGTLSSKVPFRVQ